MGCAGSKQRRRDRRRSHSPLRRSFSTPVSYPAQCKGDSYHLVALTSATLDSLRLDSLRGGCAHRGCPHCDPDAGGGERPPRKKTSYGNNYYGAEINGVVDQDGRRDEEILRANYSWPEMIAAPGTPSSTPSDEPEVINAWEMMAGLEDENQLCYLPVAAASRSFSFHRTQGGPREVQQRPAAKLPNGSLITEPMWMQVGSAGAGEDDAISPRRHFSLPRKRECKREDGSPKAIGLVQARIRAFEERIKARKAEAEATRLRRRKPPPGGEGKVVLYFTSLHGVRRTYDDCCAVRVILRSYNVRIDERDVSMDGGFREELDAVLGPARGGAGLPRVFANGRCLGGAEDLRQMHDAGELREALGGCEAAATVTGKEETCRVCGDVRFVPCETCNGSCKIYVELEDGELDGYERREEEEPAAGFRRCPDCNENGLVRCPGCCRF